MVCASPATSNTAASLDGAALLPEARYLTAQVFKKFALILHLLFISQLVSGGLFPKITVDGVETPVQFSNFFKGTVQATNMDFCRAARLVLYCRLC